MKEEEKETKLAGIYGALVNFDTALVKFIQNRVRTLLHNCTILCSAKRDDVYRTDADNGGILDIYRSLCSSIG